MGRVFIGSELIAHSEHGAMLALSLDDPELTEDVENWWQRNLNATLLILGAVRLAELTGGDYDDIIAALREEGC